MRFWSRRKATSSSTDGHTPDDRQYPHRAFRQKRQIREWFWGGQGIGLGRFEVPHALAMDKEGRLYVADRYNNRIQIFSQDGQLMDIWSQFGRPSGIYIDDNDILYCSDSESRNPVEYGFHPGWERGIRIGSVKDGIVRALIPDIDPKPTGTSPAAAKASGCMMASSTAPRCVNRRS